MSVVISSYARILATVYHMSSVEGRKKAFATCSSHMTVVTLFYGAAIYTYMVPHSYHSPSQDKIFSVFYTILSNTTEEASLSATLCGGSCNALKNL